MTKNRTPTLVYLDPGMHPGLEVKGLSTICTCPLIYLFNPTWPHSTRNKISPTDMSQSLNVSLNGGKYLMDQSYLLVGLCRSCKIVQKESWQSRCLVYLYVPNNIKKIQGTGAGIIVKTSWNSIKSHNKRRTFIKTVTTQAESIWFCYIKIYNPKPWTDIVTKRSKRWISNGVGKLTPITSAFK